MTVQSLKAACKLFCILFAVIYACYKTVLKGDPSACLVKIIPTGFQKLIDRVFIGDRHEFAPFLIVRRMKRYSKRHLKFLVCKLVYLWNKTAGRYCQISLADVDTTFFRQDMYEAKKVIIVVHRLAGSHHNHIGYTLAK